MSLGKLNTDKQDSSNTRRMSRANSLIISKSANSVFDSSEQDRKYVMEGEDIKVEYLKDAEPIDPEALTKLISKLKSLS